MKMFQDLESSSCLFPVSWRLAYCVQLCLQVVKNKNIKKGGGSLKIRLFSSIYPKTKSAHFSTFVKGVGVVGLVC